MNTKTQQALIELCNQINRTCEHVPGLPYRLGEAAEELRFALEHDETVVEVGTTALQPDGERDSK